MPKLKTIRPFTCLVLIYFISLSLLKAQHVPDKHFAIAIQKQCASCLKFNSDSTGELIQPNAGNLKSLTVAKSLISDLSGIAGFIGLTNLDCYTNNLTSLSNLPAGLTTLYCEVNQLISLPALPNGLMSFDCSSNLLTSLPTLPPGLSSFICSNNKLTTLPTLPSALTILICNTNNLTSLPTLPASVCFLDCSYNKLMGFPNLPSSMILLACSNNNLTSLPNLPMGLKFLFCPINQLTKLPTLPTLLEQLYFDNDKIPCLTYNGTLLEIYDGFFGTSLGLAKDYPKCITPVETTEPNTPIKIYPTVVYNKLNIISDNKNLPVTINDLTGRVWLNLKTTPENIDVSDLSAGIYLVRVGNEIIKVFKAH